ncbi:MAG TPA: glycosyltransferase family 1 protein [Thermoanaerobaculia bacterium]|nr:glycosyltransferase family 1 protein [Thermoanaerobaculia bacterium]
MGSTAGVLVHALGTAMAERLGRLRDRLARRKRPVRIGVDIRPFYEPLTGVGWYLYHLLHHLARRGDLEIILLGDARVTDQGPRLHADLPPGARLIVFDLRGRTPSRLMRPLTAAAYVLWMWLLDCDVIFGANYFLPRLMDAVARRRVVTIHDLTYKRFPDLLQRETLHNLSAHMTREIAAAGAVICVSESTRRDLLEFYEADARRIVAIHSGMPGLPAPEPVPGLPDRYLLFVSTIEPRKNLGVLLDAYARLRKSGRYAGSLVVAGRIGWKSDEMARRLREPGVVHVDYVPPARLATLYRNADVFVFPSIYEGFGFPVLEAMAHGTPVIAARSSSLPEIAGEAALYFAPSDVEGLIAALERLLDDAPLRAAMVEKGKAQAAKFTWEDAAEKTAAVLKGVAEGG